MILYLKQVDYELDKKLDIFSVATKYSKKYLVRVLLNYF